MTTDARSIAQIRECGCVAALVKLLRAPKADTCAAAAGAVHNISREVSTTQIRNQQQCGIVPIACVESVQIMSLQS
jgi:hypothetical protein